MDSVDYSFPIIACSSGNNANTGISVVRISGEFSLSNFDKFFSVKLTEIIPRYSVLTKVLSDKEVFDEALLVFFPAPNSFTGENVLELSVHGNILNVNKIIKLFVDSKLVVHARPGEFTKRAYVNKKLSLAQIEGLDLFLNAETPFVLNSGFSLMQGELFNSYLELEGCFKDLLASVQLSTDFVEDIGSDASEKLLKTNFGLFFNVISRLKNRTTGVNSSIFRPTIVISGKTNAGKSLLFNKLLTMDRSIVSDTHGTTRDYVSEYISINDMTFRLIDTAGIRKTENIIENEGIKRSCDLLENGFFKILVINPLDSFDFKTDNFDGYDLIVFTHFDKSSFKVKALELLNRVGERSCVCVSLKDSGPIGPENLDGPIEPLRKNGPIGPENLDGPIEPLKKNGPIGPENLGGPIGPQLAFTFIEFKNLLFEQISSKYINLTKDNPIIVERHRQVIDELYEQTLSFQYVMATEDVGIISSELNNIQNTISELIGIITPDDLLTSIFDNFCIGK